MTRPRPSVETTAPRSGRHPLSRLALVPVVGTLVVLAACSGGGEEVAATGDPAAATDTTTTTEPAPTTTTTAPPAEPTVANAEDDCPPQEGESVRYVVGFHEWPGLEEDQDFACGRIIRTDEVLKFVAVAVWDEDDFLTRTSEDPNVRYVEPDQRAQVDDEIEGEPFEEGEGEPYEPEPED